MKTTTIGRSAEASVAKYLQAQKFKIIDRNWGNGLAEIDLIAEKNKVIFFVEVKYRSSPTQGTGFDYITPQKLKQMRFGAEMWVQANNWGGDWRLMAAEVSGNQAEKIELLEV